MSESNIEEKRIAHLELIHTTIERMANNSATIKGWSMGIVAAIVGIGLIGGGDSKAIGLYLLFACACIITFVMWGLDAFYLFQEKLYRVLYEHIRTTQDIEEINYSMDARHGTLKRFCNNPIPNYYKVLINRVIWPFYLSQIIVYFICLIVPTLIIR